MSANIKRMIVFVFTFIGVLSAVGATDVTVDVGQNATLLCPLTGDYTFPQWFGPDATPLTENGVFTLPQMTYVNDKDLQIENAQTRQTGEYKCLDNNREEKVNLKVHSYAVSVRIENSVVNNFTGDIDLWVNNTGHPTSSPSDVVIVCLVNGGYPEPRVTFTLDDPGTTNLSRVEITSVLDEGKTYNVIAKLTLLARDTIDRHNLTCSATFDGQQESVSSKARIVLNYGPEQGKFSTTFNALKPIKAFNCEYYATRPKVAISWELDDLPVPSDNQFNITTECVQDLSERYNCKSTMIWRNIPRGSYRKIVKCVTTFLGIRTNEVHTYLPVEVAFPPTTGNITGNKPVTVGRNTTDLLLTCTTDSCNVFDSQNPVRFRWLNGTQFRNRSGLLTGYTTTGRMSVPGDLGGFIYSETITIDVNRYMDGDIVTCQVWNDFHDADYYKDETFGIEDRVTLNVSYSPILVEPLMSTYMVYVGDNIQIPCRALSKPNSIVFWNRNHANNTRSRILDKTDQSTGNLMFVGAKASDAGSYSCNAQNGIEPIDSKTVSLLVYDKPTIPSFTWKGKPSQNAIQLQLSPPATANRVPITYYIQYRKRATPSGHWLEVTKGTTSTELDENLGGVPISLANLAPGTEYEVRLKAVSDYGLVSYSSAEVIGTEHEAVTLTSAILIAVFVTAAVFIVLIVVVVCCMRKRGSWQSYNKGTAIPMV